MADNVNITPGAGATVAADEVSDGTLGTVKVQFVKLMDGTLDGTNKAAVGANGLKVDGSGVTQPVSAASLPLPTGAATSAKQPALGTAGTPSTDVISVQGVTSMTALKVDGSGVTQPVSGTVTANAGTNLNTSLLALETGGNLATAATNTTGLNNTVGTAASAIPSKLVQIGGSDGTNARAVSTTNAGVVKVDISATAANSTAVKVDGSGVTQPVSFASNSATGSAVPANAVYDGLIAKTALPSAGSDGNLIGAMSDKFGRQVALINTIRDLVGTQTTTISASTSETTIVTAVASTFLDLVLLVVSNTSTATNTRIDFRDTTAGSVLFSLQSNGGQPPIGFATPVPVPQTSVNTNWTAQCATSTTDVRVYAVFAKNK